MTLNLKEIRRNTGNDVAVNEWNIIDIYNYNYIVFILKSEGESESRKGKALRRATIKMAHIN